MGFPGGSEGKASAHDAGDPGSIPESGRSPGEGHDSSTPVFLPGESRGQRSLVGYSPRGHKQSDTTEATEHAIVLLTIRARLSGFTKRKTDNPLPSSSSGKGGNPAAPETPSPLCW